MTLEKNYAHARMLEPDWQGGIEPLQKEIKRLLASRDDVMRVNALVHEQMAAVMHCIDEHVMKIEPMTPERVCEVLPTRQNPLLMCVECHNTESPAGAMARYFNQGRCLFCGGYFKVVRA